MVTDAPRVTAGIRVHAQAPRLHGVMDTGDHHGKTQARINAKSPVRGFGWNLGLDRQQQEPPTP
jgi:hypothetical protein